MYINSTDLFNSMNYEVLYICSRRDFFVMILPPYQQYCARVDYYNVLPNAFTQMSFFAMLEITQVINVLSLRFFLFVLFYFLTFGLSNRTQNN
jgi:hypothetical protein